MYRGEMFILKGVLAILFGIVTIMFPGFTLGTFFTIFGLFIIAAGILTFIFAVTAHPSDSSFLFMASLGILAAGLVSLLIPDVVAVAFAVIIAGWVLVTGVIDLERFITKTRYQYYITGSILLISCVLLAAIFYLAPSFREHYIMTIFGVFALVFGVFSVAIGEMIRRGKLSCVHAPC
jgi:uncharacterized membrane protein HdeD (DUF308 family)